MERFFKGLNTVIFTLIILLVSFTAAFAEEETSTPGNEAVVSSVTSADTMSLVYKTNIKDLGWQTSVTENEISGSLESENGIQAFSINIPESQGTIKYRVKLEESSWSNWLYNGKVAGSENNTKTIRGIMIRLADSANENYDLYYQVYTTESGWSKLVKNGQVATNNNYEEVIKAIRITYTNKDEEPQEFVDEEITLEEDVVSATTTLPNIDVDYAVHVSNEGWQNEVSDGAVAGTTGIGQSIEAMTVDIDESNSGIAYSLQCQDVGWTPTVKNGEMAGTTGQGKAAEAATINLTGEAAQNYDVYYRVHSSFYGWLDWAKNGEVAGTTGIGTPAEAIQIEIVPKNQKAPGPTNRASVTAESLSQNSAIEYNSFVNNNWQVQTTSGNISGTTDQGVPVEAISITLPQGHENSSVVYQAHVSDIGWQEPVSNGAIAGTLNEGKAIQAITISLTGEDSYSYDIYYRAHVQDYGWLDWAKNGEWAGTTGGGLRLEAMMVIMLPRGSAAPGPTETAYLEIQPQNNNWLWPLDGITFANISSGFGYRSGGMHLGADILAPQGTPIRASKSGNVKVAGWYYGYGICVVINNDNSGEDVYYAHMIQTTTTPGAHVNQGDIIGYVGMTGSATANHLHLGVTVNGSWIDPIKLY